jgi:uncharacterized protein (TIGR00255 family)
MAIESMTGFARTAGAAGIHAWAWEIRSVNGRGLDIRVRVPPGFEVLAEAARKQLGAAFARGTLHCNLSLSSDAGPPRLRINEAALAGLVEAVARLPAHEGVRPASYDGLLAIRGIVELADEAQDALTVLETPVMAGLGEVVVALKQARAAEGQALETIVTGQLDAIAALTQQAETHPARSNDAIRARLAAQVAALLEASQALDPQRLQAHVAALRVLLAQGGPIGRKLDFLSQEFGREASTLCAKAGDASLSRIGLDLRTVVDQMREQVQNVE